MLTIIISLLTITTLIFCIIKYPVIKIRNMSVSSFWVIVLVGALLLIVTNQIGIGEMIELTKKEIVNPIEILILFISITFISIILDEVGFFNMLATSVARRANGSQLKLFLTMYFLVAILTIFTSNDIIILTFTPFICMFAKKTKINPIPYLVSEFVAANTWSIMLVIGNPTNIFLSLTYEISFIEYFKVMAVPAITSGIAALAVLYVLFRKELKKQVEFTDEDMITVNKPIMIISLLHLTVCTILLAISSFINIEMWFICFIIAISISFILVILNRKILWSSLKRAPWNLVPFVLSMFVMILALDKHGLTTSLGEWLITITEHSQVASVFVYGFSSILADNLINNIPMSLAAIKVLHNAELASIYAVIIGSNIGAYLTPIGALAGIMWMSILKKENVELSFAKFIKIGLIIVPLVAMTAFLTLLLVI